ncbi:hypothetical protein [Ammonifex thiophilus]|uniref:hypothetical protein n=1 Tax=Ammonifex thiophilus TaxID=444093 RepID=UPI001402376F|nr:hypothetical protein [Ammonifex thiophilus]
MEFGAVVTLVCRCCGRPFSLIYSRGRALYCPECRVRRDRELARRQGGRALPEGGRKR